MKALKTIFMVLMILAFFADQVLAGEEPNSSDLSSGISIEHRMLVDQLNQLTGGRVKIKTYRNTGKVSYIGGDPSHPIRQPAPFGPEATSENAARGFLSVYGRLFGLKDQSRELKLMRDRKTDRGRSSVRFQQIHSGIPIFGGELIVQTDSSNNIISAHGKVLPDIDVDTAPAVSSEAAEKKAREVVEETYQTKYAIDQSSLRVSPPELWIYNPVLLGEEEYTSHLVWRMEVTTKEMLPIKELVLVDAQSGEVVLHFNQIDAVLNRKIYDHNNTPGKSLPGSASDLRRSEGQGTSGITDVDKAYDYAGDTYNFYFSYHGRDSINNRGIPLVSTTRFCPDYYNCPYENAFWYPPLNQMVYGQGYASADDVVAHEMTHGVTDYESNLIYNKQSGAINESFSDIWGEFVDLTNTGGNDTSGVRWLMGEDLPGGAIRDMANPPDFGDPDRVWSSSYWCFLCDNGGVHINSGIGNKAAYLMTDGGLFNGITVTGIGLTKVAKIFYEAQAHLLTSASDYNDLAFALEQACVDLIGTDGITDLDCQQVQKAIETTEMDRQPPVNKLKNPGFESGGSYWTQYHSGPYSIFAKYPGYGFCGSNWFAWLGGYNNAVDSIHQDILIPANATLALFEFYSAILTDEPSSNAYDHINVEVRRPSDNALLQTLAAWSNANKTTNWVRSASYNLLSYKGQTIRLRFSLTTDYSNSTSFYVDDVVLKVVAGNLPVVTSFRINAGGLSTAKNTVVLNNAATNGPVQFKASESPTFDGALWHAYSTAPSFILSTGVGTKTVYFKVKNGIGESVAVSDTIEALAPVVTSFKINGGALSTASASVTLNNTATNFPTHYMVDTQPDFLGKIWQTYSTAPKFTLGSGSGTKTLYIKVRNVFGESTAVSDTIEALAPVVTSFKINAGGLSTTNGSVTLNNTATNLPTHYMASESASFAGAIWQKYSTAPSFALSIAAGTKTVYFKVRNVFSESAAVTDTISTLAPVLTSFKINAGAANTANGNVTLNNTATNSPTHYMASESGSFVGASWQKYSTAPKFVLNNGAGTRTIYFKVKNVFAESNVMSDTIVANGLPPVVTSFKINAGASSTANRWGATLNNTATNVPMYYMASESPNFVGEGWWAYSAAPKFTLSAGSGTKTVYFKTMNIFGESPVMSDTISALAPVLSSFKINAGAASTANQTVTLSNTATNSPTLYMASESPSFAGASWMGYSTAPKFALSSGAGTKTVYFKVENGFAESNVMTDTIVANGLPPVVTSFKINAGGASTANALVTLNNTATNLPMQYMASEDPNFGTASWQAYTVSPKFFLSSGAGTKTVYFKTQNIFGVSAVTSDTILALAPALTSFKINAGAASTTNGVVTLNNTATNLPVGPAYPFSIASESSSSGGAMAPPPYYMASESPSFAGANWLQHSTAPKFLLSDGAGTKTVYFKVLNGFVESNVMSDAIVADGLPPVVTSFTINAGAASTANFSVTLNHTGTNFPMYYMASESPSFSGASWEQIRSTVPYLYLSGGSGTKTVYFKTRNIFGESSVVSDTIFLHD